MDFKINQYERDALMGLPHVTRLLYFALRPYMDYSTGIVGIKRGISYQALREELYVEPHTGYENSGSPSKQQIRRAIKTLERIGLITIQSEGKKLILKCELATWDYCDQNKPDTNPTHQPNTKSTRENTVKIGDYDSSNQKADTVKNAQPDTPPVSGINYMFLCDAFEKFWSVYPAKFSKAKAWEIFQELSPSTELFEVMITSLIAQCDYRKQAISHGHWMPSWKHAANWLSLRCWEDELPQHQFLSGELSNAPGQEKDSRQSKSTNALWEYCKDAFVEEHDEPSNVVSLGEFKQKQCSY